MLVSYFLSRCTALALLCSTSAAAQVEWTQRALPATPPARHSAVAAFDSARGRLVVFGGFGTNGILGDHWEWDGTSWTEFTGARPPARSRAAMAYDRFSGSLVLFGGDLPNISNDTWVFDGAAWTPRNPAARPAPRFDHALAFDTRRRRAVLFGGVGYNGAWPTQFNDTWEWDGTTWIQRLVSGPPPARSAHAMAYDESRGVVVLFGGDGTFPTRFNDTWEWNGTRRPA